MLQRKWHLSLLLWVSIAKTAQCLRTGLSVLLGDMLAVDCRAIAAVSLFALHGKCVC